MHILANTVQKQSTITGAQKMALNQCLKYWPAHRSFEDVLSMVRQDSINILPLPSTGNNGSLADHINQLAEQASGFTVHAKEHNGHHGLMAKCHIRM